MANRKIRSEDISITITRHYRPDLEFSVVSTGGLFEILRLYVEVEKMYYCVRGMSMKEAMHFRTRYSVILVPTIRVYPLLPPTTNTGDTWLLKEKDADLFGISFKWPSMMAVDIVIKIDVYDHMRKANRTVSSETIRLQRNGEDIADRESKRSLLFERFIPAKDDFVPEDNPIPFSPYLYKLITIDGFIDRVNVPDATQLNKKAHEEIVALKDKIHPAFVRRLTEIDHVLHSYIIGESTISTTILFLAADPSNASRLRLGEELREIQEKLQLAKLRERFTLEQRMSVRPTDVSQGLLDVQPNIVHFSGHGKTSGELCFENKVGEIHPIQPEALAALFEQFSNQVGCVLLNACYSEKQANAIAQHIDYVIGMSKTIGDRAVIAFAIGFYQALGAGRTIEDAYKLGCVQIRLQDIPEHLTPVLIKKETTHPPNKANAADAKSRAAD